MASPGTGFQGLGPFPGEEIIAGSTTPIYWLYPGYGGGNIAGRAPLLQGSDTGIAVGLGSSEIPCCSLPYICDISSNIGVSIINSKNTPFPDKEERSFRIIVCAFCGVDPAPGAELNDRGGTPMVSYDSLTTDPSGGQLSWTKPIFSSLDFPKCFCTKIIKPLKITPGECITYADPPNTFTDGLYPSNNAIAVGIISNTISGDAMQFNSGTTICVSLAINNIQS